MGPELRRDKKHNLRSKWWYGRYMINGKRHFINLNVEVKGKAQNARATEKSSTRTGLMTTSGLLSKPIDYTPKYQV